MKNQKVFVMGHKNPDTDSICSAIAYADIKNRTTQTKRYIPFWRTATGLSGKYRSAGKRYGYPSKTGCRPYHVPEKCLGYDAE